MELVDQQKKRDCSLSYRTYSKYRCVRTECHSVMEAVRCSTSKTRLVQAIFDFRNIFFFVVLIQFEKLILDEILINDEMDRGEWSLYVAGKYGSIQERTTADSILNTMDFV